MKILRERLLKRAGLKHYQYCFNIVFNLREREQTSRPPGGSVAFLSFWLKNNNLDHIDTEKPFERTFAVRIWGGKGSEWKRTCVCVCVSAPSSALVASWLRGGEKPNPGPTEKNRTNFESNKSVLKKLVSGEADAPVQSLWRRSAAATERRQAQKGEQWAKKTKMNTNNEFVPNNLP